MKKIKWNKEELEELANAMVLARVEDPMSHPVELLNKVQDKVLSPNRIRRISAASMVPDLMLQFQTKFQEFVMQPRIVEVEKIVDHYINDPTLLERTVEMENAINRICTHLGLDDCTAMGRRIIPMIEPASEVKKKIIGIIGPRAEQQRTVAECVPVADAEIRVWENLPKKDALLRCDMVFCMSRFVHHGTTGNVRGVLGSDRCRCVDGGITNIVSAIKNWIYHDQLPSWKGLQSSQS